MYQLDLIKLLNLYSGAEKCKIRSNYDASTRFYTNALHKQMTRSTQYFNMAAIFQQAATGYAEIFFFCLKMATDCRKDHFNDKFMYSTM